MIKFFASTYISIFDFYPSALYDISETIFDQIMYDLSVQIHLRSTPIPSSLISHGRHYAYREDFTT